MKVRQLLAEKETRSIVSIRPDESVQKLAQRLMKCRIGALVVADKSDALMGIVSERDLVPIVAEYSKSALATPVAEIMTSNVITCSPEDEIAYVLRLMNANAIRHMPVVNDEKLVDMLSIRELTKAYELLQIEANTDPLTGLSNRRPFLKSLEVEFARARRVRHDMSVAMIDLDHFKTVNDTHGHDAGDAVLVAMAAMMINEFRTIEMVGRLGGEEFAVIFPQTDLAGATIACNRLIDRVRSTITPVGKAQIEVTISVGLANASPDKLDGAAVLKHADELLYAAKRAGRDRLVSAPPA
ncbi:MAG: diguanylate cyclase [Pseudomonadota bacterium]